MLRLTPFVAVLLLLPAGARAANPEEPARLSSRRSERPATSVLVRTASRLQPEERPIVTPPPPAPTPVEQYADVVVEISYWGEPVKSAQIILRGPSFDIPYDPENEYKNPVLRQNRYGGVYVLPMVPFRDPVLGDEYVMEITAIVKNRTYKVVRPIRVGPGNKFPDRSFIVQLEQPAAPPPPPPAP